MFLYTYFLYAYLLTLNCRWLDKNGGWWDEEGEGEEEAQHDDVV
jgi:hypothetical protein